MIPSTCFDAVVCCVVGYTMDTLYFTWIDNPVDIEKNLEMPQFSMEGFVQNDCSQNYTAGKMDTTITKDTQTDTQRDKWKTRKDRKQDKKQELMTDRLSGMKIVVVVVSININSSIVVVAVAALKSWQALMLKTVIPSNLHQSLAPSSLIING